MPKNNPNIIDGILLLERASLNDALEFFLCEAPHERQKLELLSERVKVEQINLLVKRMLASIRVKQDALDTRSIDDSKGDLKRVKDHDLVHKALMQIRVVANGPHAVDDLIELEKHVLKHSEAFRMAYANENDIGIWFYETCVMDLFYGTMLVIAQSMRTVKLPNGIRMEADMSASIGATYAIQNVRGKNRLFRESKVTAALNNSGSFLDEAGISAALGGITLGVAAVFLATYAIRWSILQFYNMRRYISGEFKIVASFLELNAATLSNKETARKQETLARKFNELADSLRIKDTTAEKTTKGDIKREVVPELKSGGISPPPGLEDPSEGALV